MKAITTIGHAEEGGHFVGNPNGDPTECMNGLRAALEPGQNATLIAMLMNSGKSVNQFGDPDTCRDNPDTTYTIVKVVGVPVSLTLGI